MEVRLALSNEALKIDLKKAAETYLLNVGLTQEEVDALRKKLSSKKP